MSRPRLVFAGTPDFAAAMLRALADDGRSEIVAVYTQPDRPAGRGKQLLASPVKQEAERRGFPVRQPFSLKDAQAQAELRALDADLMIVAAYGLLLPQAVLDAPRLGCINVHASLLPRWRGAAPVERAIEAGDAGTGITIMQMDAGLDTGAMLLRAACPILPSTTGDSLRDTLAALGAPLLVEAIDGLLAGRLAGEAQDGSQATYARKLTRAEAAIDWREDAVLLERRIRAFQSANTCSAQIDGQALRVLAAGLEGSAATDAQPGTILAANAGGIRVQCGRGVLRLEQLQLAGGKPMTVAALLNGRAALFAPGRRFDPPAGASA